MVPYHLLAGVFALLLPVVLFVCGDIARRQRRANYRDVVLSLFDDEEDLPQLALVGAKYDYEPKARKEGKRQASGDKRHPAILMLAAFLYAAICFIGFELLIIPIAGLVRAMGMSLPGEFSVRQAFVWSTGADSQAQLNNTVAVTCMAFLGAYVANARYLVKQMMNMELNGVSFARAILLIIMGVTVALVSYRTLSTGADKLTAKAAEVTGSVKTTDGRAAPPAPGPATPVAPKPPGPQTDKESDDGLPCKLKGCVESPSMWLGLAFLIGFAPEAGLGLLMRRLSVRFQKRPPDGFFDAVSSMPIEIIDGIDSDIAYRLEENNVEDIQNLATANPLELYIDTPYGFYECFDWVIQAQLCLVTGMDNFVALRRHGVRTIFDLERAVLSEDAPKDYVLAIGEVLFSKADDGFKRRLGGDAAPLTFEAIQHAVGVIQDDLHVHRLRSLWVWIEKKTAGERKETWLHRKTPIPGDKDYQARPPPAV